MDVYEGRFSWTTRWFSTVFEGGLSKRNSDIGGPCAIGPFNTLTHVDPFSINPPPLAVSRVSWSVPGLAVLDMLPCFASPKRGVVPHPDFSRKTMKLDPSDGVGFSLDQAIWDSTPVLCQVMALKNCQVNPRTVSPKCLSTAMRKNSHLQSSGSSTL